MSKQTTRLDTLKCLLRSVRPEKPKDDKTRVAFCPTLTDEELTTFLEHGENATKTALNLAQVPGQFSDLVVEYAMYVALMSNSIVEKGREYSYADNGVNLSPPPLAEHMMSVARALIDGWHKKIAYYKG